MVDKKHKEIVLLLLFISNFLWLNKQLFYLFYIFFFSFTLRVCGEKNILPNLTNSQEPEPFFWPLGAGAVKKITRSQSQSRLGKKSGAGAAWKSQEPEPLKN